MEQCILNIAIEFVEKFGNTFYMYMVTMDMLLYTFGIKIKSFYRDYIFR